MARDGLALPQRDAGMGVAEVVNTRVPQFRFRADPVPEALQPDGLPRPVSPRSGKHPSVRLLQCVEDAPGGRREPDGPGAGLAVAEEEMALPVVGPAQCQDLALPASGQQKKADHGDLLRTPLRIRGQRSGQAAQLLVGQEALAPLPAIAPDAPAGVGALRPVAHRLRLPHDDGEHRHGPVGGDRRRAQRGEPVANLLPVDVGDGASGEMRQDLVAQVAAVHVERSGLPDPFVPLEHGFGDGLEEGFVGPEGRIPIPPNRSDDRGGLRPRVADLHARSVADDLPDAFPPMLAVNEEALAARRQHADAEALEFAVTNVVSGLARVSAP